MGEIRLRTKKSIQLAAVSCFCLMGLLVIVPRGPQAPLHVSADRLENPADGMAVFQVKAAVPASLRAWLFKPELQLRVESGRESVRVLDRTQNGRTAEMK